ncbi:MAG: hypothetical protein ACK56F_16435, partial [bacterium]
MKKLALNMVLELKNNICIIRQIAEISEIQADIKSGCLKEEGRDRRVSNAISSSDGQSRTVE